MFLSEQHREALAHLLYGASETGGFVLLTGEVGTGKTTVCRAFLEQLPEGVEIGLVLNPALTGMELMAAVCEEFGVELSPGERSTKIMLDRLNNYLLDCHARGRQPVLIIDEAQNLRPVVLEQVRLLTNLETTKHKLLQIFLVGQPELRTLLAKNELRQLNQRITARFHLVPLSLAETSAYIRHRLSVAGVERPLFSRAAVRRVHHHSGGVPRLINLICDRALLGAAVSHRLQANAAIVDQAAREVRGNDCSQPWPRRQWLGIAAAAMMAAMAGLWVGASGLLPMPWAPRVDVPERAGVQEDVADQPGPSGENPTDASGGDALAAEVKNRSPGAAQAQDIQSETASPANADVASEADLPQQQEEIAGTSTDPIDTAESTEEPAVSASEPEAPNKAAGSEPIKAPARPRLLTITSDSIISGIQSGIQSPPLDTLLRNSEQALQTLLHAWGVSLSDGKSDDKPATCDTLPSIGLACERGQGRWSDLRRFDRPFALQLSLADGAQGQVIVVGINDEFASIDAGEGRAPAVVPIAEIDQRWSGDYLLLWQLPPTGDSVIGRAAAPESIRWLRAQLRAWPAGDPLLPEGDDYDQTLMTQVRAFQSAQGLDIDGIAGPHTLILLANALTTEADAQRQRPEP
nr:AAA family ATPase [Thiorhodovibrio winogradskyi]